MVTRGAAMGLAVVGVLATGCNARSNDLLLPEPSPYTSVPGGPAILEDAAAWVVDAKHIVRIDPIALVEGSMRTQVPRDHASASADDAPANGFAEARWIADVHVPAFDVSLLDVTLDVAVGPADETMRRSRKIEFWDEESRVEVVAEFNLDEPPTGYASVGPWRAEW